jgi:hypothetical protein
MNGAVSGMAMRFEWQLRDFAGWGRREMGLFGTGSGERWSDGGSEKWQTYRLERNSGTRRTEPV